MCRYICSRLLQLIPLVFFITLISFAVMYNATGDAVDILYDQSGGAAETVKAAQRSLLGLDQPFVVQYFNWLTGFITGDMGKSYISTQPVMSIFTAKLPATIQLMVTSIILTLFISLPLGVVAALKRNRFTDYFIRLLTFSGNALPGFFIALLLIYLFALKLNWLPVLASGGGMQAIVLPTLTLAISMSCRYIRQIRAVILEELNSDYVIGARARGVSEWQIVTASVLRNALPTIITFLALSIGSLLGGAAIIETIFMWDGVGKMAVDAIVMRDYPLIQAYVIWMSIIYVLINLITDLVSLRLNPRIRMRN